MSVQLVRLAEVNPSVPEFDSVNTDALVTFMPLETCWPDGRADTSRRAEVSSVANGYTRFRSGDVLVPKITPTFEAGRVFSAHIETGVGAATTELHVLRARASADPRFLAYVCRSQPFLQEGAASLLGVGNLRRVSTDYVRTFPVAPLSLARQQSIADYLDRETTQIDRLIAKQEQLITSLGERRIAAIDIEFSREHTASSALKYLLSHVDQGVSPQADSVPAVEAGELGVLKSGCANYGQFRQLENKLLPADFAIDPSITVHPGDLIVSRASGSPNLVGSAAIVDHVVATLILSDKLFRLRVRESVSSRYVYWFLNSSKYREQVRQSISGAAGLANNLPLTSLRSFATPVPAPDEQRKIADSLDDRIAKIDLLISKAEQFIALAKERRAALITAAVTGRIDVSAASTGSRSDSQ